MYRRPRSVRSRDCAEAGWGSSGDSDRKSHRRSTRGGVWAPNTRLQPFQGSGAARSWPADDAHKSRLGRRSFGNYDPREAHEARLHLAEGKARSIVLLREAIRAVEDEIADREPECHPALVAATRSPAHNRKVFVVHGREEGPREAVARFLERLGFEPIILHEQANQGRTVIEKVEDHSDVGFAVIILTPNDMGNLKGEAPQPRARQNVLLELGYFIGKLTRKRVCTLKVGDLEIPSDWRGVVDEPYDAGAGWRQTLARELEAAGYEIDWNKVMRR